ncbi:UNVERIFIED_CONTAM: Retrovirus-related Pol polyprotein from transposon RE1 [Sesamum latifolium]|uniref:Retrovirus-related Pol polyprotein from transposon RE1 n=1 Tax=Sesamum latifolium TaxID=2727402 RepID=A0AAW2U5X7_9LAMI
MENAMNDELTALERNQTWEIVDLPKGTKAIGSKWVYKVKLKPDGSIDRYKARLVAKGYNQVEGVDYFDRFSPIAKAVTVRILLALVAGSGWAIHQVDINNAFLHGLLEEDIYMLPQDGSSVPTGKVCKLKRSLSILKQASRQWNQELTAKLVAYGFSQSLHEHCVFIKHSVDGPLILLVYVDDVLITGACDRQITDVKGFLDEAFTIKDVSPAKFYLGLEIARSAAGISVTQCKYVRDIIQDVGLSSGRSSNAPFPPTKVHMDAALHLVRYLKGVPDRGLFFPNSNQFALEAFYDADSAGCVDSKQSLTGYCVYLGDALISWKTKKQSMVTRSTVEVEYHSLNTTVCRLQWISYLLNGLHISHQTHVQVYCDNQVAIHIVANPYKAGFIMPMYVSSRTLLADLFTKLLPASTFQPLLSKLGLVSPSQIQLEGGLLRIQGPSSISSRLRQSSQVLDPANLLTCDLRPHLPAT